MGATTLIHLTHMHGSPLCIPAGMIEAVMGRDVPPTADDPDEHRCTIYLRSGKHLYVRQTYQQVVDYYRDATTAR